MAKKKSGKSSRKVNKTAWIRSQPAKAKAKDIVAKAKAEGITLSISQVYTARSTGRKKNAKAAGARAAGRSAGNSTASAKSDELAFRRLVLAIGLQRAEAYLADLKRSVGL